MRSAEPGLRISAGALALLLLGSGPILQAASRARAAADRAAALAAGPLAHVDVVTPARAGVALASLPVAFEAAEDGSFVVRTRAYAARLAADRLELGLGTAGGQQRRVGLVLRDARPDAPAWSSAPSGHANYLQRPTTPRPLHAEVGYRAAWRGIDVRYRGTHGRVEQDFLVAPGADTGDIAFRCDTPGMTLTPDGALTLALADGSAFRLEAPRAWQIAADGRQVPVAVKFRVLPGSDVFGFTLGARDTTLPLVIDPVLSYTGALGGDGDDEATAVAFDAQGRIHLAGYSSSTDLGATRIGGTGGRGDVFVARLDPTGQAVEFLSFFGGSAADSVRGLAVDAAGRVHVTGATLSTDFPLVNPLEGQATAPNGSNAFVSTVAANGASLTFSSYLGGSDADEAHAITVGPDGRVVVVGETRSANFPLRSAHEAVLEGLDGFVTVLGTSGALQWSTFLGGQVSDSLFAVAVDGSGAVVVAGASNSPDYPGVQGSGLAGGFDATVARFSPAGALLTAAYLGGAGADAAQAVVVDAGGQVYVGGSTASENFPSSMTMGPVGTSMDAFVATYGISGARGAVRRLGGSGMDRVRAIAIDQTGLYLAGQTASADFPVVAPAQLGTAGNRDAFVVMLAGTGVVYSTYVGTSGNDDANGVAVDGVGRVALTGTLQASGTPDRGATDAFLFRLSSGTEGSDTDNDRLPDAWETQFNLDPRLSDASGDPDGDGLSNLQEYQEGTHPVGRHSRYLAEGATIPPFETRLALFNPTAAPAAVLVRFLCQRACGVPDIAGQDTIVRRLITLAPFARGTLEVSTVPGLADEEFATIIEADQPVVVDRTMTWDATAYGSHTETAMLAPAATWTLAEGATTNGFKLYYLLQNPNPVAVTVTIEYLLGNGAPPVTMDYVLPPRSRTTLDVAAQHARLRAAEISARLVTDADTPILVERAMYLNAGGRLFGSGHASAGITTPAPTWSFAEGATGTYFDTFLLIANTSSDPLGVRATFLLPDGRAITRTYDIGPKSRFNIWVDRADPELADTAVSTLLESVDDRPFVAERAMWWPGPAPANWREAHNSPGSLSTSARWGLADGMQGGALATDTYVLVANTSPFDGVARVTLFFEDDGSRRSRDYPVPARSRTNVPIREEFPEATGRRFATLVESQGALPAQLVVERAMYADTGRERWASGTNALGTPLANERVITITPQGVTPRVLVVAPGERITVRNADTQPHQIFSGPHLERSTCPALNQIGYLAPGEARNSGNFTSPGTCPFLDDVRPGQQLNREFQGYIIVK